jgi:SOS response associated peptidase (SRAP)
MGSCSLSLACGTDGATLTAMGQVVLHSDDDSDALTATVHVRMPVILYRDDYELWFNPGMTNVEAASKLLKPFDARLMHSFPVSSRINQVANDDEEVFELGDYVQYLDRLFAHGSLLAQYPTFHKFLVLSHSPARGEPNPLSGL